LNKEATYVNEPFHNIVALTMQFVYHQFHDGHDPTIGTVPYRVHSKEVLL